MPDRIIQFDDETIQLVFGHEAAEDEDPDRLTQYYFKSQVYERITAELPLRLLVGHKGIGKSALFTVAMHEDRKSNILALLIRPDDVVEISTKEGDFLQKIREWKTGLMRIIYDKAVHALNLTTAPPLTKHIATVGNTINFVTGILKPLVDKSVDMDAAKKAYAHTLLKNQQINIYLDDLDRGWTGDPDGISRLSTLLNALRDLPKEHAGLRFKVALRTDVYFLVRTADESTDKIEGSVVWHSWSNHQILAMLVKRVESFFGRQCDDVSLMKQDQRQLADRLDPVLEPVFHGQGLWKNLASHKILMSLIRKRPRDLVKLCTLAAQAARENRNVRIGTEDFKSIFETYSQGRLQDTTNEFRTELPDVERLLLGMKPNRQEKKTKLGYVYATDALLNKIRQIEQGGRFRYANGKDADTKALAYFLYKINFLTARKELASGKIVRKYFEENKYLSAPHVDFGFHWEIHPAYRWALQPEDPKEIFERLEPSEDERD